MERTPLAYAVTFNGEHISYTELNQRANALARVIRQQYQVQHQKDLSADTLIALYLDRGIDMIISILAVLKAGAAYVPISPKYPKARTQYIITDTVASIVITHKHYQNLLQEMVESLEQPLSFIDAKEGVNYDINNLNISSQPHDLAYIIYTSGTTGQPKGVAIEHKGITHSAQARLNRYPDCKAFLLVSDYVFDSSLAGITGTLLSGGKLVISDNYDPDYIVRLLIQEKVTHFLLTPSLYSALIQPITEQIKYLELKTVIVAGEKLSERLYLQHKQYAPNIALYNEYGPTENSVWTTFNHCTEISRCSDIGIPIDNVKVYVLDDQQQPVPIGSWGELYISGPGLARGYFNRPELTSEYFIDNPFTDAESTSVDYQRLYRTGDIVRWHNDGTLGYQGRRDKQVKIRGYRIELEEIENTLQQQNGIKEAVVIEQEQGGHSYLAAFLILEPHCTLNIDECKQQLRQSLADYMVPHTFTVIDAIPLTINGKLDRQALPKSQWKNTKEYVAPRSEMEAQLCELWQQILNVEKVGIHDNFFQLGGNS
ncbi:non-ribosomal peptide synthetase, partial [Psychrobacter aquimaris]|uniref:non-ribosomal peptide synthetase n=1 Tax=Psychrobacter aquimaris TaxID=292733 RepID=UPI003FD0D61A